MSAMSNGIIGNNTGLDDSELIVLQYLASEEIARHASPDARRVFYRGLARDILQNAERLAPLVGEFPPLANREVFVKEVVQRVRNTAIACGTPEAAVQALDLDIESLIPVTEQAIRDRDTCVMYNILCEQIPVDQRSGEIEALPVGAAKAAAIDLWMHENPNLLAEVMDLDLSDLGLKTVPAQLFLLPNLVRLDLNDNQIQTLVGVNLPAQLQGLFLDNNQIQTLEGVNLPAGLDLRLQGNPIRT